jgi:hypothetical protein
MLLCLNVSKSEPFHYRQSILETKMNSLLQLDATVMDHFQTWHYFHAMPLLTGTAPIPAAPLARLSACIVARLL